MSTFRKIWPRICEVVWISAARLRCLRRCSVTSLGDRYLHCLEAICCGRRRARGHLPWNGLRPVVIVTIAISTIRAARPLRVYFLEVHMGVLSLYGSKGKDVSMLQAASPSVEDRVRVRGSASQNESTAGQCIRTLRLNCLTTCSLMCSIGQQVLSSTGMNAS